MFSFAVSGCSNVQDVTDGIKNVNDSIQNVNKNAQDLKKSIQDTGVNYHLIRKITDQGSPDQRKL